MKRIEKAHERYPNKQLYDIVFRKMISFDDCCPYYADSGNEDLEPESLKFDDKHNVIGCRGITCTECWNKEFEPYVADDGVYIE